MQFQHYLIPIQKKKPRAKKRPQKVTWNKTDTHSLIVTREELDLVCIDGATKWLFMYKIKSDKEDVSNLTSIKTNSPNNSFFAKGVAFGPSWSVYVRLGGFYVSTSRRMLQTRRSRESIFIPRPRRQWRKRYRRQTTDKPNNNSKT